MSLEKLVLLKKDLGEIAESLEILEKRRTEREKEIIEEVIRLYPDVFLVVARNKDACNKEEQLTIGTFSSLENVKKNLTKEVFLAGQLKGWYYIIEVCFSWNVKEQHLANLDKDLLPKDFPHNN